MQITIYWKCCYGNQEKKVICCIDIVSFRSMVAVLASTMLTKAGRNYGAEFGILNTYLS